MFTVQTSEFINHPIEDVFAFFYDKQNLPQWGSTVVSVKLTSSGSGTAYVTYLIIEQPPFPTYPKVEFNYVNTNYDKNRSFEGTAVPTTAAPITGYKDYYQFEVRDQGTYVTMREEILPRGIFRMLQPLMQIMIRKLIRSDLAKAKKVLEAKD